MTAKPLPESTIQQVTSAINSLNLDANESQPLSLIGDDFDRSWNTESLTLPNPPTPTLLAELAQQNAINPSDSSSISSLYQNLPFATTKVLLAKMVSLDRLTTGDSKFVYEACLQLPKEEQLNYEPGDCIGILCENPNQDVNWLLEHIDLGILGTPDTRFVIKPISDKINILPNWFVPQTVVTVRILLTYCCEIHIPLTRRLVRLCAEFCSSQPERIRLLELSSRQGHHMFEKLIREPDVTLLDLFVSFPSVRLPVMRLLELLPRLQPRSYSLINLSNTSSSSPQELRFMFTRVDFPSPQPPIMSQPIGLRRYPNRIHGTCTGWLERLWNETSEHSPPEIRIYLRDNMGKFRLPEDPTQPVIMIGAGTGLAPFLSFIESRESLIKSSTTSNYGPLWLIFGCRSYKTSLLYEQHLLEALEHRILHHLCLCFSRDPITSIETDPTDTLSSRACLPPNARYVQDCLTLGIQDSNSNHATELSELILNHNAKIMVCGEKRNFAPSVQEACSRLVAWGLANQKASLSEADLEKGSIYVKQMQTEKRYQVDVWI